MTQHVEHLADDNELAAAYLAAAPDAIIVTDELGSIVMANPQAETLFGFDPSELIGQSVEVLVPREYQSTHRAHWTRYRAKPTPRQMGDINSRVNGRRKDGSVLAVEIALSPVVSGAEHRVIAIIRDLTTRIARESQHELVRRSLDTIEDAVFIFDPESLAYSYVNTGAVTQLGYSRSDLTNGMTPLHIMPSYTEAAFRAHIAELTEARGGSISITTIHRRQDGVDVPVEVFLQFPRLDSTDEPTIVAVVRDITERKASEDRLRASEHAFRTAFSDAPVAMVITQAEGHIVESNQAFTDLLGWEHDDLNLRALSSLTEPESGSGGTLINDPAAPNLYGPGHNAERRYRHRDGHIVWGALHAAELQSTDGQTYSLSHIVDVTRRVEAEHQRDRREQLLTTLAEIRKATMQDTSIDEMLAIILSSTSRLLESDHSFVAIPTHEGGLVYRAMRSSLGPDQSGNVMADSELIKDVLLGGQPLLVGVNADGGGFLADTPTAGPGIMVPLLASGSIEGVLVTARPTGAELFTAEEMAIATSLGSETAVTMELARARSDRRRIFLVEDRERIARDLHDVVIQRLFAAGMSLNSSLSDPEKLESKATTVIDELDATIDVIRETIFKLTQSDSSLSGEIGRIVDRYRMMGRNHVVLDTVGNLDSVPEQIADHLLPTLNEMLSNVERHANATTASTTIEVNEMLVLTVTDDGSGIDHEKPRGFGIRNITNRAEYLGGSVKLGPGPEGVGTTAIWSVPLLT